MKKRVTIKDIANKAGVSTGTVDRVLHNRGNVAADVKKRVEKVMDELGYEKNLLASALAYNRTIRVMALLPEPEKDPYWKQTEKGVKKAAKSVQHYGLLVETIYFNYADSNSFLRSAKEALSKKPAAILFPPMFSEEAQWLLEKCKQLDIPNVMINTYLKDFDSLCYIGQDSYQSGVLGARLLNFGLSNEQTACILNLDFRTKFAYHLLDKERGFRAYFADNKEADINIIREDFDGFNDPDKLSAFLKNLLDTHPSLHGIFVTNSRAYKVLDCLEKISDRKIKIVGFDLVAANLKYLYENKINFLINQNPMEQGFYGVTNLFQYLVQKKEVEKRQYLPLDIVVKENADYYLKKQLNFEMAI